MSAEQNDNSTLKIIVVDDKYENLVSMQSLLKKTAVDVDIVESGNEALSLMLRHEYALALVDVQMPDMDGFELVELMRLQPTTSLLPVIFLTAINTDKTHIYRGYEVGAIDYICKPVDTKILLSKVNFFLAAYEATHSLKQNLAHYKLYSDVILGSNYLNTAAQYSKYEANPIQTEKQNPKILIVDDKEENIFSIKTIIDKLPIDVDSATSGQDAIKKAEQTEYAVILLDVQMPMMDGFEVATHMKANDKMKDTPIIFLTAINKEDLHVFHGYQVGAVDYLFKPLNPDILRSKIYIFIRLFNQRTILRNIVLEKEKLVDEVKRKNEKLGFLAYHDALTMVPNRKGFQEALEKTLLDAIRFDRKFAVIQVDIDHFKSINDTYGHQCGDLVLQEVANRLKACLRRNDYVARLGGDEFAIILSEIKSIHGAGSLAEKIINRFNESFKVLNYEIHIGLSAGIACYLGNGHKDVAEGTEIIMQNADSAMYKAKHDGRGTYQYYTKEFNEQLQFKLKIEHALRFALEKNELFLMYQPKFCLKTKKIMGAEALARWKNQTLGFIPPSVFIPLAEETQMIVPIGRWVTEQACLQLKKWLEIGHSDAKMAINLSPVQLLEQGFEKRLFSLIKKLNLSPKQIELELTETAIMDKDNNIFDILRELDKFGLIISIDDFGTGYSMLSYLKRLPVNCLKIDMEFVQHLDKSRSDAMIVKSIIDLAKNFELDVVAEGVEKQQHVDFLLEQGCKTGQGYYFCKPMMPEEFEAFVQNHQ